MPSVIHKSKKIGFVHNPRTGGAAVSRYLLNYGFVTVKPHAILAAFPVRPKFAFTFVRTPWDRMVSHYYLVCKNPHNRSYNVGAIRKMGFKAWFLLLVKYEENSELRIYPKWHLRSQTRYSEGCHFVGRFENLQNDFNKVCGIIGVPSGSLPIFHHHITKHPPYQEVYDDETRKLVAKWFAPDIEQWGYKF